MDVDRTHTWCFTGGYFPLALISALCAAIFGAQTSYENDLFGSNPTQAVTETTGLEADGVTAAQPRAGGGASIDSASSLTTDTGRRFENVRGAEVDGDGNVIRADSVELDGNSFEDVEDLAPVGSRGFSAARTGRVSHRLGTATDGVGITAYDVRLSVEGASTISVPGITAYDVTGFLNENGVVSISRADRIEISDGILAAVEEFAGNEIEFTIESARDVVIGCVSLRGIEKSRVALTPNDVLIQTNNQDVDFTISDCGFEQSAFQAFSENSSISIPRSAGGSYEIRDGELTCLGPQVTDRLETSDHAKIEYGEQCFSCLTLEGSNSYWHNSEEIIRDFGLTFPDDTSGYRLCIRKQAGEQLGTYDGSVDFVEHRIELSGRTTYRRLPSKEGELLSFVSEPVFESLDPNNEAELLLDPEFDRVTGLTLQNSHPSPGVLAFVNSGHYQVYERSDGAGVKRFGRFADRYFPDIIETYRSNFGSETPVIIFENDIMIQGTGGSLETGSRVTAVCDTCARKTAFENEMTEQSLRFPISAGRCGT